jgi:hypothetical protein
MLPVGLDDAINALCEQAAALGFPSPKADIIREIIMLGLEPFRDRLRAMETALQKVGTLTPATQVFRSPRVKRGRKPASNPST